MDLLRISGLWQHQQLAAEDDANIAKEEENGENKDEDEDDEVDDDDQEADTMVAVLEENEWQELETDEWGGGAR